MFRKFRNVLEIRNDPEFRNNVPEISGLREKNRSGNRSGIPDFRNLFHNGNGKNFLIISIRKPQPGISVETLFVTFLR